MKKTPIYVLLLTAFFVLALTGCGKGASGENGEVIVYNWGEYTGENIIQDFEEKTGAKVVMENFDSNEQMYMMSMKQTKSCIPR